MKEPKKASFGFKEFTVPSFSYNNTKNPKAELDLLFDPKGELDKENKKYYLTLNFQGVNTNDKSVVINVVSIAEFQFSEIIDIPEIPEYFYANSIAIMFPYVRSFISTMTLQANTGIIMLETLNLSGLKDVLKTNTKLRINQ
jgi:preprotein translocase subunit SecB